MIRRFAVFLIQIYENIRGKLHRIFKTHSPSKELHMLYKNEKGNGNRNEEK